MPTSKRPHLIITHTKQLLAILKAGFNRPTHTTDTYKRYCRLTPTEYSPCLGKSEPSMMNTPSSSPKVVFTSCQCLCLMTQSSHLPSPKNCCIPRTALPSAPYSVKTIGSTDLRGRANNSPCT